MPRRGVLQMATMRIGRRVRQWIGVLSLRRVLAVAALAGGLAATAVVGEAVIRARLDSPLARSPTRIYARPVALRRGVTVDAGALARHLDRVGYREAGRGSVGPGEYRLTGDRWIVGLRPFPALGRAGAAPAVIQLEWDGAIRRIEDAGGSGLDELLLEPVLIATLDGDERESREPVPLSAVPQSLVEAILAVEDRRFFEHAGLDVTRIAGAAVANLRAGRVVQGGSTISQQLAKNLFLSARRSPIRKIREAAMAVALEARYDKARMLEAYLNEVYFGQDGAYAIRGVGSAARYYFDKDVGRLSLAESALLAGIVRGPNLYSPVRHPEAARDRRDLVLWLMHEQGRIDAREYGRARRAALGIRRTPRDPPLARHFVDVVAAELVEGFGRSARRGHAVFTTLDPELQRAAERAVRDGLRDVDGALRVGPRDVRPEAALVALDPRSGDVLALVGGRDYGRSQFNRAVQARRQPGSAFKPIVALAALGRLRPGEPPAFTLASVVEDEPLVVETPVGRWEPDNYDGRFRGSVTLRVALERSLNVPFARLGLAVGAERIAETGRALGIASPLRAVPSLALGTSEVTPLELTRAFGVLAAAGTRVSTRTIVLVTDAKGNPRGGARYAGERVVEAAEAYLVTSALEGAVERGTGQALRRYGYRGAVAGKSGTSSDWRDAWFVAYSPSIAVGAWVGFDDARSLGLTGSRAALPIVGRVLAAAGGRDRAFPVPDGVEFVEVNSETGLRAGYGCWGEPEVFLAGTAPTERCGPSWGERWDWDWRGAIAAQAERLSVESRRLAERFLREMRRRLLAELR